jgi:hypothetical protein
MTRTGDVVERSSTLRTAERPGTTGTTPPKSRLVVGNGMSGARALEEILARGGGDTFAITVFGDEPYGNYNRILLSEVLANAAGDAAKRSSTMGSGEAGGQRGRRRR